MRCEQVRRYLPLYLDSELGLETTAEIARHLERCGACRERMEGEKRLEAAFAAALTRVGSSDRDAWRRAMTRASRGTRRLRWALASATVVAVAAVAVAIGQSLREGICLSHAMAANHTKYLSGALPPAVETGTPADLEAYFAGKLPFRTTLGRTSGDVALVGGRSCYLDRSPCAHVTAHVGQVALSLFVLDESQLSAFPATAARMIDGVFRCRRGPFHVVAYRDRGRIVGGIAELPPDRLEAAVRELSGIAN